MSTATEKAMALSTKGSVAWYYSSCNNPWVTAPVSTRYRDSDTDAIEETFRRGNGSIRSPRAFDVSRLSEFREEAEVVFPLESAFKLSASLKITRQKHSIEPRI